MLPEKAYYVFALLYLGVIFNFFRDKTKYR